jgi:hypothetical protein
MKDKHSSSGHGETQAGHMESEDVYALVHVAWLMIVIFTVGVLLNLWVVLFHV